MARVAAEGRQLALIVQDIAGEWSVVALEASAELDSPEALFHDHAHKSIGTYRTVPEAFAAAQSFAEAWLKKWKATRFDACECDNIPP